MLELMRAALAALPAFQIDKKTLGELKIKRLSPSKLSLELTAGEQHLHLEGHFDEIAKQLHALVGNQ